MVDYHGEIFREEIQEHGQEAYIRKRRNLTDYPAITKVSTMFHLPLSPTSILDEITGPDWLGNSQIVDFREIISIYNRWEFS